MVFIFGAMHIPVILIKGNLSIIEVSFSIIPEMIMHIYFVGVYKIANNSVLSSTIVNSINNFIMTL